MDTEHPSNEAPSAAADQTAGPARDAKADEIALAAALGMQLSETQQPDDPAKAQLSVRRMIAVAAVTVVVGLGIGAVGYVLFEPRGPEQLIPPQSPVAEVPPAATEPVAQGSLIPGDPAGISWQTAERTFASGNFDQARREYEQLLLQWGQRPGTESTAGLFRLRIAECIGRTGSAAEYRQRLDDLAEDACPLVRAVTEFRRAALDFQQQLWSQARTHASAAIGQSGLYLATEAMAAESERIVARSLAHDAVSLSAVDASLPWIDRPGIDPLAVVPDDVLVRLANESTAALAGASLGPQIIRKGAAEEMAGWQVACLRAPVEEAMGRICQAAGMELQWVGMPAAVRRRAVTALTGRMNPQQLLAALAGSVGLIARFDGRTVRLHDPVTLESTDSRRDLLIDEATSAWRRQLLQEEDPAGKAEAHYVLGVLAECHRDFGPAIVEYRLTARQYPRAAVAPLALMRSSRLCLAVGELAGAQQDLTMLIDTYPNFAGIEEVFLALGQTNLSAGRYEQAITMYRKVFRMNRSIDSKSTASWQAGHACHQSGDWPQAVGWFEKFLALATPEDERISKALYLKACSHALAGDAAEAAQALRLCLAAKPPSELELEALMELARVEMVRQRYSPAVIAISRARQRATTRAQRAGVYLLQARITREVGLPEQAFGELRRHLNELGDEEQITAATVELARCAQEAGDNRQAYELLVQLLSKTKDRPQTQRAQCRLAELALKLGKPRQAITLAEELLHLSRNAEVSQRALHVLSQAHLAAGDYEAAAAALAGQGRKTREDRRP